MFANKTFKDDVHWIYEITFKGTSPDLLQEIILTFRDIFCEHFL